MVVSKSPSTTPAYPRTERTSSPYSSDERGFNRIASLGGTQLITPAQFRGLRGESYHPAHNPIISSDGVAWGKQEVCTDYLLTINMAKELAMVERLKTPQNSLLKSVVSKKVPISADPW